MMQHRIILKINNYEKQKEEITMDSIYIVILVVLMIVVYLVYMKSKVKRFVLRNDKIEKYYKNE